MNILSSTLSLLQKLIRWFLNQAIITKLIIILVLGGIAWISVPKIFGKKSTATQVQTALVEKGTLITTLTQSGTVAVTNRVSVTTQASGIVDTVYVKNGDPVTAGQKIALLRLDTTGLQRQAAAWASYQSAKASLESANAALFSLQSTMLSKWDAYKKLAENSTYQNSDTSPNTPNRQLPQFMTIQDDWLAAEAQYKNQQNTIAQAQASLTSNWLSYQAASATVVAPAPGILSDLIIVPGMQVGNATNTTSSTNGSSQVIGSIKNEGNPVITVNLSEVDVAKAKAGQKATITFDALPGKTFTGKLLGINTAGSVTSGVTTYPASIQLDVPSDNILPNMAASATIITNVKDDVLLVPTGAIQTIGGQSTIRVVKKDKMTTVPIEIGDQNDTQTEVTSGLVEGDVVITSAAIRATQGQNTTSPFSAFGGRGFGGGGR